MSKIFRVDTFGMSTVFSTPCDAPLEDPNNENSIQKQRVTVDDLYLIKQRTNTKCQYSCQNIQNQLYNQKNKNKLSYDDLYIAYMKIWENPLAQRQTHFQIQNEQANLNLQKQFQINTCLQQAQFQNYLKASFQSYNLAPQNKEIINLEKEIDQQYIEDLIIKKSNSLKLQANVEQISLYNLLKDKILNSFQNNQIKPTDYYNYQQRDFFQQYNTVKSPLQKAQNQCQNVCGTNSTTQSTNSNKQQQQNNCRSQYLYGENIRQPNFQQNFESIIVNKDETYKGMYQQLEQKQINNNEYNYSQTALSNNCNRTKDDDEDEFDLSFDENFFLDLNKEEIDNI